MAKFRSKVSKARPDAASLRTTIPNAVVELISLKDGDTLVWNAEPKANCMVVTVSVERQ